MFMARPTKPDTAQTRNPIITNTTNLNSARLRGNLSLNMVSKAFERTRRRRGLSATDQTHTGNPTIANAANFSGARLRGNLSPNIVSRVLDGTSRTRILSAHSTLIAPTLITQGVIRPAAPQTLQPTSTCACRLRLDESFGSRHTHTHINAQHTSQEALQRKTALAPPPTRLHHTLENAYSQEPPQSSKPRNYHHKHKHSHPNHNN
jgi:hypothetical protein